MPHLPEKVAVWWEKARGMLGRGLAALVVVAAGIGLLYLVPAPTRHPMSPYSGLILTLGRVLIIGGLVGAVWEGTRLIQATAGLSPWKARLHWPITIERGKSSAAHTESKSNADTPSDAFAKGVALAVGREDVKRIKADHLSSSGDRTTFEIDLASGSGIRGSLSEPEQGRDQPGQESNEEPGAEAAPQ